MVDSREDKSCSQAFLAQMPQGLEKGVELSLVGIDDAVVLLVGALLD